MSAILLPVTHNEYRVTWPQAKRLLSLMTVILMHIVFFYLLLNNRPDQTPQKTRAASPKEVTVSLITLSNIPEPKPPTPQPTPLRPPPIKKIITPPPVIPIINEAPAEQAIVKSPILPKSPPVTTSPEPISLTPVPAPPQQPKTISTGVEYLHAPKLEYPSLARRMGEEGRVALRVLIDENGHPTRVDVQKTSGFARLDSAAQQAVLHATFKPHIENGKATAVYVILPFDFHLDNQ